MASPSGRRRRVQDTTAAPTTPWRLCARTPWARKRTVPVVEGAGDGAAARPVEERCGERSCCFLPVQMPGRKRDKRISKVIQEQQEQHQDHKQKQLQNDRMLLSASPPATTSTTSESIETIQVTTQSTTPCTATNRTEAFACSSSTTTVGGGSSEKAGGGFGPTVGLTVVAAVSMAGLLGGRVWAVVCMCAWFCVLSRLRRRPAVCTAGKEGVDEEFDVDSKDYKKLVVLRGLLERDRRR